MVRVYNNPYTTEKAQSPNSQPIGTIDLTLGLAGASGVTFFAVPNSVASYNQVARAVALQDNNNMVIALDGESSTSNGASEIYLNMFDTDGLLNPNFNSTGQATVSLPYDNQYVNDMIVFNVDGVNKAILAGYATSMIGTGSLLMQYNLSSPIGLDGSFGGLSGNPSGVAFGDGQQLFSVSRQTMGRIITSGIGQDNHDVILAYTAGGKLDKTFASGGYYSQGTNPIYTHVIDSLNNIVIAYNDGSNKVAVARILADGSGLDSTYGSAGIVPSVHRIGTISGNSNMRIAIDNQGYILATAVVGQNIVINRYTLDGTDIYSSQSLTISGGLSGLIGGNGSSAYILAKLLMDIDGKAIIVVYDTDTQQNIVIRTTATLSGLDSTFNAQATSGYLRYGTGVDIATDAMISNDGRIIVIGATN